MTDFLFLQRLLVPAFLETLYMVGASTLASLVLGLPLGILLFWTGKKKDRTAKILYKTLSLFVNIGRSFPFAILMIILIPFTRFLIGTSLGTTAAIIPLTIAATPFLARLIESSFVEIHPELLQAISLIGARPLQLFRHVLLVEALPSLVRAITITMINITGYSAMSGLIGGGGLGQIALQYGYQRFNTLVLGGAVFLLFLLIEVLQRSGSALSHHLLQKRGLVHHV